MSSSQELAASAALALGISIPLGYAAYRKGGLSPSGYAASVLLSLPVALTGWQTLSVFLAFFSTSTVLTKWKYSSKEEIGTAEGGRNWKQVVGAGGVGALLSTLLALELRSPCCTLSNLSLIHI